MRTFFLFLLFVIPGNLLWSQKAALTYTGDEVATLPAFIKTYKGKIGQYPIVMKLINWQDGTLSGTYHYTKVKKAIELTGDFTEQNQFEIREMVSGETTGTFTGRFDRSGGLSGVWKAPAGARELPFKLKEIVSPFDQQGWTGDWHLNGIWDSGLLVIGNVGKDTFEFGLQVFRSGHVGVLEGEAAYSGKEARFHYKMDWADEPCKMTFRKETDSITVEQLSSSLACGFGMRAYAGGTYDSELKKLKATLEYGGEEDPFDNQEQHDAFLRLVGQDYYDLFAFNMQVYGAQENQDAFSAKVVTGMVVGLFASNEAIIMTDQSGHIWAATIDFEEGEGIIRYFTNDKKYKKRLPKTIETWKERFGDYRVSFE